MKEAQTPIVKIGTQLSIGKVIAIENDHVVVDTHVDVFKFSFFEIEAYVDAE